MTTGTRQAYLPGGRRTGAPGKHVVRGKAKYRLLDEKVRFFVAPPVEEINASPVRPDFSSSWPLRLTHPWGQLRPYVDLNARLTNEQKREIFGKLPRGGMTGEHYFQNAPRRDVLEGS
jgi:large subunit ribosomal protein L41